MRVTASTPLAEYRGSNQCSPFSNPSVARSVPICTAQRDARGRRNAQRTIAATPATSSGSQTLLVHGAGKMSSPKTLCAEYRKRIADKNNEVAPIVQPGKTLRRAHEKAIDRQISTPTEGSAGRM